MPDKNGIKMFIHIFSSNKLKLIKKSFFVHSSLHEKSENSYLKSSKRLIFNFSRQQFGHRSAFVETRRNSFFEV